MREHKPLQYRVLGENNQSIEVSLDHGEGLYADAAGMLFMEHSITMETVGFKNLTFTDFSNTVGGTGTITFTALSSGQIVPIEMSHYGECVLCDKNAFLCMSKSLMLSQGGGLSALIDKFRGNHSFEMTVSGKGTLMLQGRGKLVEKSLNAEDSIKIALNSLIAMTDMVTVEPKSLGFIKASLKDSESIRFATVRGPGTIWMQTERKKMPNYELSHDPLEALSGVSDMFAEGDGIKK